MCIVFVFGCHQIARRLLVAVEPALAVLVERRVRFFFPRNFDLDCLIDGGDCPCAAAFFRCMYANRPGGMDRFFLGAAFARRFTGRLLLFFLFFFTVRTL
jgi:hypothetical protein